MRVLAALALVLAAALPARAASPIPNLSGLPWPSGMVTADRAGAEAWRNRRFDVVTTYFGMQNWQHVADSAGGLMNLLGSGATVVIAMPMLPKDHFGEIAACAAGSFDAQIATVRARLVSALARYGSPGAQLVLRLGWEANRLSGPGGYAWQATDPAAWVGCWKRWAAILNPAGQPKSFLLVWNMGNRGTIPYPIARMYPGDAVVDVIASQFYDRCPPNTDAATWSKVMWAKDKHGNPASPGQWLSYARYRNKPYAVPEWGVGGTTTVCARPGTDNAYFIGRWYAWLLANAADIAFESYFNGVDGAGEGNHTLFPVGAWPLASAEYRARWGCSSC